MDDPGASDRRRLRLRAALMTALGVVVGFVALYAAAVVTRAVGLPGWLVWFTLAAVVLAVVAAYFRARSRSRG